MTLSCLIPAIRAISALFGLSRIPLLRRLWGGVVAASAPESVMIGGHRIYLDAGDALRLSLNGEYDPYFSRVFREQIHPGMVVYDIGAHIGYFTLMAGKALRGDGRVYAFEPDENNAGILRRNADVNGYHIGAAGAQVWVTRSAAWCHAGTVDLFRASDCSGGHRLYGGKEKRERQVVPCFAVDDIVKPCEWPELVYRLPDVIKMDIEGAEHGALLGMRETVARCPGLVLFTEMYDVGLRGCGSSAGEYLSRLREYGFSRMWWIDSARERLVDVEAVDVVAMSRKGAINLFCKRG